MDLVTGGVAVYPRPVACGYGLADPRCLRLPVGTAREGFHVRVPGCFENYWNVFHLATIYLAKNDTNIFMAGTKGNAFFPSGGQTQYQNLLYVLPSDGSCASQSLRRRRRQSADLDRPLREQLHAEAAVPRAIQVTSLAAGNVNGTRIWRSG